jgi:hypothetical protein
VSAQMTKMTTREPASPPRRDFLTATSVIGGGLLLGAGVPRGHAA